MKRIAVLAWLLCSCCAALGWGQSATPVALKDKYHAVEVEKFKSRRAWNFPRSMSDLCQTKS